MKARKIEKVLLKDGWFLYSIEGSHHQYKHKFKTGKITIPFHSNKDLKIKTVNNILKQAGLK